MPKWLENVLNGFEVRPNLKKVAPDGSLKFAVGIETTKKQVCLLFPEPISELNMHEDQADKLAVLLIQKGAIIRETKREESHGEKPQRQRQGQAEDRAGGAQEKG